MQKNILIATSKFVRKELFETFFNDVCKIASEKGIGLLALHLCSGPGCQNFAFSAQGGEREIEDFAETMAIVLAPARFTFTDDPVMHGHYIED